MSFTVLIVDDSATTRAMIKRTVMISGLPIDRTFEAGDGKQALETTQKEHIDIIITDLNMPVMGGVALTQSILADPATRHIPVVVVSADPNTQHAQQLADVGVRGFIRKPFTPEALRNTLGGLLPGVHQ